jgi:hypothetical protein
MATKRQFEATTVRIGKKILAGQLKILKELKEDVKKLEKEQDYQERGVDIADEVLATLHEHKGEDGYPDNLEDAIEREQMDMEEYRDQAEIDAKDMEKEIEQLEVEILEQKQQIAELKRVNKSCKKNKRTTKKASRK